MKSTAHKISVEAFYLGWSGEWRVTNVIVWCTCEYLKVIWVTWVNYGHHISENILKIRVHSMHVEINSMHIVCIRNKNEYYKRLTIKGLNISFYQTFRSLGIWSKLYIGYK